MRRRGDSRRGERGGVFGLHPKLAELPLGVKNGNA